MAHETEFESKLAVEIVRIKSTSKPNEIDCGTSSTDYRTMPMKSEAEQIESSLSAKLRNRGSIK
jgi:hypothetical protein